MNTLSVIATIVALVVGLVSILGTFAKIQRLLSRMETRDLELREEIRILQIKLEHVEDKLTTISQGLKDRMEHINMRVSSQLKEAVATIRSVEGYLQKNTAYERRENNQP